MKLITKDTDYAVKALCLMSGRREETISVYELSEKLKIPRPFLRKILYTLNKNGIVRSRQGKRGGFRLAISSEKIFLLDLIGIFQGPLRLNNCLFKKKVCREKNICMLRRKIEDIENTITSKLKSVSIGSLIDPT